MAKRSIGRRSVALCAFLLFCVANVCAAEGTSPAYGFFQAGSQSFFATMTTASSGPAGPIGSALSVSCRERLNHDILGSLRLTEDATEVKPRSPKKKVGRIMTIAGLGAAILGGVMVAAAPERPNDIADSGVGINWRATGFAWIGVGLGVAIAGLILGSGK
jgi:hypothetical protein